MDENRHKLLEEVIKECLVFAVQPYGDVAPLSQPIRQYRRAMALNDDVPVHEATSRRGNSNDLVQHFCIGLG